MKHLLLIGDGMADLPIESLGGVTPLEAARTPAMDALCAGGRVGRCKTVPDGLPVGSDTAILSIFGCSPTDVYTGRAPLEAAGMGLSVAPGETAFRANLIAIRGDTFRDGAIASHAAGGMEDALARQLMAALDAEPSFAALMRKHGMRLGLGDGFRNIALFADAFPNPFCTTPPHDILDRPLCGYLPDEPTLRAIMEAAYAFLNAHPINAKRREQGLLPGNGIWFWGEGTAAGLPGFFERYGKRGSVVTAVPLVKGIARLCGLEAPHLPGANGGLDTDFDGKVATALATLAREDFAAVHYEAPDECGHAGNLEEKIEAIELFDARIVAPMLEGLAKCGEAYRVLLMPDHPTPISTRTHLGQFVPYVMAGEGIAPAGIPRLLERHVEALEPVDPGTRLMDELME